MARYSRYTAPIHRSREEIAPYGYEARSNPYDGGQAMTIGVGVGGGMLVASLIVWALQKLTA